MLTSRPATESEIAITGLRHRVYIPAEGSAGKPLVVYVHGRAGTEEVMWVFSKALERIKPVIVSPQATIPDLNGFSWWPVHEKLSASADAALRAERLREVEVGVLQAKAFIEKAHEHYGTDRSRTYIAGFSQGGALSATLSLMEPRMFRGVGILSGFIPYAVIGENGLVSADVKAGRVDLPPYFIFHGTEDPVLPFSRAEETRDWLRGAGATVDFHQDAVAHKVSSSGIKALGEWFDRRFAEA
ncbi:MAG: PHB depolymerase family esterase [Bdellovibrionota bacterium]